MGHRCVVAVVVSALRWQQNHRIGLRAGSTICRSATTKTLINIVYYWFNDVNPSHIILVDCCIHLLRGRGPVAAASIIVDRRDDPQCRKMPPPAPFPPPPSPPPPQIAPTQYTWRAYAGQRSIRPRGRQAKQLPMLPRGVDVVSPEIIAENAVHTLGIPA